MLRRLLLLIILFGLGLYWQFGHSPMSYDLDLPPEKDVPFSQGLTVQSKPLQTSLGRSLDVVRIGDYAIEPVARFEVQARVLGVKRYRFDAGAQLSPVDLALGWGPMARDEVLGVISITQSGRFYCWRTSQYPIPRRDIERSSANMHLIPAGRDVGRDLRRVRKGQTVHFSGYLVNVRRDDGWRWLTSTTRDDTGSGACEIVLVTGIRVIP